MVQLSLCFNNEQGGKMDDELKSTRHRPGWLIPYLLALDNMFYGRWNYWLNAVQSDSIPDKEIPYIAFKPSFTCNSREVRNNVKKCRDPMCDKPILFYSQELSRNFRNPKDRFGKRHILKAFTPSNIAASADVSFAIKQV